MREHDIVRRPAWLIAAVVIILTLVAGAGAPRPAQAQRGDSLRVATKPLPPFVFLDGEQPTGFSVDLWQEVARRLGLTSEWVEFDTVGEILSAVETGAADIAIAGITMTREREGMVDFTHPYFDAGLQIMVPSQASFSLRAALDQFRTPGMRVFLLFGLVAGVVMAHFIYFVERRQNPQFQRGYGRGLWEAVWWLLTIVSGAEYPEQPTTRVSRRLMTIAFWLIGLLLVAQFTANVTSALTVQQLNSDIRGPEDLPGKRIATVEGSTSAAYLTSRDIRFTGVPTIDQAYALMAQGEVDAIVYDAPVLRYYSMSGGQGSFDVIGAVFKPEKYGIALPIGSPLREPINEALLEMYQDGTLEEIEKRWFGE